MAVPPAPRRRLPRSQRVQRSAEFAHIRQTGRRMVRGVLIANWTALPPDSPSRVGVITSRKIGSAVVRNRARRLLREAFRLHQHELQQPATIILVARNSIAGQGLAGVERDYVAVLRQAGLLCPAL